MNLDDQFFKTVYAADIEDEEDSLESSDSIEQFLSTAKRPQVVQKKSLDLKKTRPSYLLGNFAVSTATIQSPTSGGLRRVTSFPDIKDSASRNKANYFSPPALKSASSAPPKATNIMSRPALKRQKTSSSIPEADQFFKGKKFYFLPNNRFGVRGRRIEKFEDYGGTWVENWSDDIHLVVLESNLKYGDLTKYLKTEKLPVSYCTRSGHFTYPLKSNVLVVTDRYISDCLASKAIMKPELSTYRVRDDPASTPKGPPPTITREPKPSSLEVKPVKRKELRTPSPAITTPGTSQIPKAITPDGDLVADDEETVTYDDELSKLMKEAKSTAHLMIDDDIDEESSSSESEAKEEVLGWKPSMHLKYQDSFSCMFESKGTTSSDNPNAMTIKILDEMGKYYDRLHDPWRTIAYRKAVTQLKHQVGKVSTKEEVLKLQGVGDRIAEKIEEIVITNRLRRLDCVKDDPTDQVLTLFLGVYGVGPSQASRWVQAGYRTLEELKTKVKLTPNQLIGIEHYDDFQQRIPRDEVTQHGEIVRKALLKMDPGFLATVGGSYRRGATDSGDIDILITKSGATLSTLKTMVLEDLVPKLFKSGFLQASLAVGDHKDAGGSKFHGVSTIPGSTTWRRIDLLLVPWEEVGAALIYFTGNDIFNRSIRLLARKKGMRLNQRGLYKNVMRGQGQVKLTEGKLVESRSEKRIFEILGVPWRPPQHRIC